MPRATIWIKEKNYRQWQELPNKSAWINMLLEEAVPLMTEDKDPDAAPEKTQV